LVGGEQIDAEYDSRPERAAGNEKGPA
jgi:hypothetical protein